MTEVVSSWLRRMSNTRRLAWTRLVPSAMFSRAKAAPVPCRQEQFHPRNPIDRDAKSGVPLLLKGLLMPSELEYLRTL